MVVAYIAPSKFLVKLRTICIVAATLTTVCERAGSKAIAAPTRGSGYAVSLAVATVGVSVAGHSRSAIRKTVAELC